MINKLIQEKLERGWRIKGLNRQFDEKRPLISIITAVYNSCNFFEETILSIINQNYDNLEYIIIDGGSTDGTVDIIKKYDDRIAYWVSEEDKGISDAFNKGVKVCQGTYINFQGAGDLLETDTVLEDIFGSLKGEPMFVSGQIKRVDEFNSNKTLYVTKDNRNTKFQKKSLLWKMTMPHQGLFTHRDYFKNYGLFDTTLRYSMDYEHLLRAYKDFPEVVFAGIVAKWRSDGLGNGKELEIFKEYDLIKRKNKIVNPILLNLVNFFIIIKFYIKKLIT